MGTNGLIPERKKIVLGGKDQTVGNEETVRMQFFIAVILLVLLTAGSWLYLSSKKRDDQLTAADRVTNEKSNSIASVSELEERYAGVSNTLGNGASLAHPEIVKDEESSSKGQLISFNRHVRPILSDNCFFCHGPDAADRKGDLRLDTEEGLMEVISKGKPGGSELIQRIFHTDPDEVMPPSESSRILTDEEKATLTQWIKEGAKWQQHWAFEVPAEGLVGNIDTFIEKEQKKRGLVMSTEASKETLIRRATLDLTGLPPTVKEIDAFLADTSKNAYEELIDRLLLSSRYAERMTWQWLEASRYADTDGYQNDGPRIMWRWRDWVLDAFASNMPFDQFTIEQLAGDLLPNATLDQKIATGFNRNHRYNSESGLVLEEFLLENTVDRVDTTSTVWMGMTVACARCHDHKYDPISQKEYYQLASFFDAVPESGRATKGGNSEPWVKAPTAEQTVKLKSYDEKLLRASAEFKKHEVEIRRLVSESTKAERQTVKPVVRRGLKYHFGKTAPILANGVKAVKIADKILGFAGESRFSIAFTIVPEKVDSGSIFSNEANKTTRVGIFAKFDKGHFQFAVVSRWIAGVTMIETERTFKTGEEVHIVVTNDGTRRSRGMNIYVNGKLEKFKSIHNTNSNMGLQSKAPLRVGATKYLGKWKGEVSDLRMYVDRTLEQEEVELLYSGGDARRQILENGGPNSKISSDWNAIEKLKEQRLKYLDSIQTTMVMEDGPKLEPTKIRVRGEYHNHGESVTSGTPEVFPEMPSEYPRNRLGLARWLVSGDHPLTARVAVNRYWQMLFGTGLVKTTEDFGTQGSPPSHPELLDWLAVYFVENDWNVKKMLKTIMMSKTYRQSSHIAPVHLEKDPLNKWLARAPRLKLRGNVLRDQALSTSGLLVEKVGGPSVKPYQPANLWKEASNFTYTVGKGDDLYRRSIYTFWKRTLAPPSMAILDTADREWCSVKPKTTNTPLQALTLLNETAFFEASRKLGERILENGGDSIEKRVVYGFKTVVGRVPSATEKKILIEAWKSYLEESRKYPEVIRKINSVGASKQGQGLDPIEHGAATAFANVLYNLEEVSVRE